MLLLELQIHAGLLHSKHICAEEQLAIFLHIAKTGKSVREIQERFQHSPDTISRLVKSFID
jgi:transposase